MLNTWGSNMLPASFYEWCLHLKAFPPKTLKAQQSTESTS